VGCPAGSRMKTLDRYILKRATTAFLMTLAAMTGVVWATQALRQLDLVTSKGQTILQFISITMLAMPFLVVIVAPFALMIALILVLNALSSDSELIVINAAGGSRFLVLRPVLIFAVAVMALGASMSLYFAPLGLAELRSEITRVRADLIANIIKPGRFITVEDGLTFHIRNRSGNGSLDGLLLHDTRDGATTFSYQAESGQIVETSGRTLLVMQDGTIQRRTQSDGEISIVRFKSYAFDLSSLIPEAGEPVYKASERSTAALLAGDPTDAYGQSHLANLQAELHERFSQPLYAIAFALIVFAWLGQARTTRQNRGLSILGAITACVALRTAGFGVTTVAGSAPGLLAGLYVVPAIGIALALWSILSSPMRRAPKWQTALTERLTRVVDRIQARLNGGSMSGAA